MSYIFFYICLSAQFFRFIFTSLLFQQYFFYPQFCLQTRFSNTCILWFMCLVSPRIVPFSFEEPIFAGQAAQVTCLVSEGDAPIHFSWLLSGQEIPLGVGIDIQNLGRRGSNLMIESAESRHGGNYTCSVRNTAGTVQYTTLLNVHGNCPHVLS